MKVKLLQACVGNDFAKRKGDTHDFPDAEAQRLISKGYAEEFKDETKPTGNNPARRS